MCRRAPGYAIYLLNLPLSACLACECQALILLVSLLPSAARGTTPAQRAALGGSELAWELSVLYASSLKLCLAQNLEPTKTIGGLFLNENFISLF